MARAEARGCGLLGACPSHYGGSVDLSRPEVAESAGVDVMYIDRLVDAGILRPEPGEVLSLADVRRAQLVRSLELAAGPLPR